MNEKKNQNAVETYSDSPWGTYLTVTLRGVPIISVRVGDPCLKSVT